jgi:hypothetical protein
MTPRTKLAAMMVIFAVPTLASFAAFYWFPPSKTSNYGELISPALPMPNLPPTMIDGSDAREEARALGLRGKWLFVTREGGACDAQCEKKLFAMRQTRLIIGREMDRVVRVVLVDDDVAPREEIVKRYQGTAWINKLPAWLSTLPVPASDVSQGRAFFYAVDPLGNVFMRYGIDADGKLMAKDLQRVLKASQIG